MRVSTDDLRSFEPFEQLSTMALKELRARIDDLRRVRDADPDHLKSVKAWAAQSAVVAREAIRLSNQHRVNEAERLIHEHNRSKPKKKTKSTALPMPRPAKQHAALIVALVEYALEHLSRSEQQAEVIERFVLLLLPSK